VRQVHSSNRTEALQWIGDITVTEDGLLHLCLASRASGVHRIRVRIGLSLRSVGEHPQVRLMVLVLEIRLNEILVLLQMLHLILLAQIVETVPVGEALLDGGQILVIKYRLLVMLDSRDQPVRITGLLPFGVALM
jgi:hypothetical protein